MAQTLLKKRDRPFGRSRSRADGRNSSYRFFFDYSIAVGEDGADVRFCPPLCMYQCIYSQSRCEYNSMTRITMISSIQSPQFISSACKLPSLYSRIKFVKVMGSCSGNGTPAFSPASLHFRNHAIFRPKMCMVCIPS